MQKKLKHTLKNSLVLGEGIYKSGMYIVDEEEARWNLIDNLIEQYRNNIEKLTTIKREIIRRNE